MYLIRSDVTTTPISTAAAASMRMLLKVLLEAHVCSWFLRFLQQLPPEFEARESILGQWFKILSCFEDLLRQFQVSTLFLFFCETPCNEATAAESQHVNDHGKIDSVQASTSVQCKSRTFITAMVWDDTNVEICANNFTRSVPTLDLCLFDDHTISTPLWRRTKWLHYVSLYQICASSTSH